MFYLYHRQASFVQTFNEDEIRSANIRYFFPTGCQSPSIEIGKLKFEDLIPKPKVQDENEKPLAIAINENASNDRRGKKLNLESSAVENQPAEHLNAPEKAIITKPTTVEPPSSSIGLPVAVEQKVDGPSKINVGTNEATTHNPTHSNTQKPTTPEQQKPTTPEQQPETPTTTPETPKKPITEAPRTAFPETPKAVISDENKSQQIAKPDVAKSSLIGRPEPITTRFKNVESKCSDTCCDDNRPQILMTRASPNSCCKGVSKIVIPIDMEILVRIGTSEIIEITSEPKTVEMLKKLLKLVEKYAL